MQFVGLDANLHAVLMKRLLGKLNVPRFDFGRFTSAPGPTQRLVMGHELLNCSAVLGDDRVTAVKSEKGKCEFMTMRLKCVRNTEPKLNVILPVSTRTWGLMIACSNEVESGDQL